MNMYILSPSPQYKLSSLFVLTIVDVVPASIAHLRDVKAAQIGRLYPFTNTPRLCIAQQGMQEPMTA